jgi:hypothetical protein
MCGVAALDRDISASVFRPMLRGLLLPGFGIGALLVPQSAFAQQSPTSLPEIRVVGTTPLRGKMRRSKFLQNAAARGSAFVLPTRFVIIFDSGNATRKTAPLGLSTQRRASPCSPTRSHESAAVTRRVSLRSSYPNACPKTADPTRAARRRAGLRAWPRPRPRQRGPSRPRYRNRNRSPPAPATDRR